MLAQHLADAAVAQVMEDEGVDEFAAVEQMAGAGGTLLINASNSQSMSSLTFTDSGWDGGHTENQNGNSYTVYTNTDTGAHVQVYNPNQQQTGP